MAAPLEGIRVLDLTRLLPGGYCTLLLADLGADVIKVEQPGRGDDLRWAPPVTGGVGAAHAALNRGKRAITLNLKAPEGAEILRRLARDVDVVVESFRPGVMDRRGVGHRSLQRVNPRLVYCAITGFGQDGPYRDRAGHDLNYIGIAGALGTTGRPDGPPIPPSVQVGDLGGGGMAAAIAILAALIDRDRTGRGRFIDTSMLDGVVSWLSIHLGAFLATGHEPTRGAMPLSGGYACYAVYRCSDGGFLTVAALEPRFWRALCEALDLPALIADQFASPDRQRAMAAALQAAFERLPRDAWLRRLEGIDACVGPVNGFAEALEDPQIVHRGLVAEVDGKRVGPSSPFRMDGERATAPRPAPRLGEHTTEVLASIGIGEEEIPELRARGVV
jgi:crotonobetainyl-CoA:carnitine CoA-transferase CaiB-like acyl-CoA transferase